MSKIKFIALTDEASEHLVNVLEREYKSLGDSLRASQENMRLVSCSVKKPTPTQVSMIEKLEEDLCKQRDEYFTVQQTLIQLKREVVPYVN